MVTYSVQVPCTRIVIGKSLFCLDSAPFNDWPLSQCTVIVGPVCAKAVEIRNKTEITLTNLMYAAVTFEICPISFLLDFWFRETACATTYICIVARMSFVVTSYRATCFDFNFLSQSPERRIGEKLQLTSVNSARAPSRQNEI